MVKVTVKVNDKVRNNHNTFFLSFPFFFILRRYVGPCFMVTSSGPNKPMMKILGGFVGCYEIVRLADPNLLLNIKCSVFENGPYYNIENCVEIT